MVHNHVNSEFLTIEERIRRAGAERSVELGYAIGDTLARIAHRVSSLLAHRHARPAKAGERFAAGD